MGQEEESEVTKTAETGTFSSQNLGKVSLGVDIPGSSLHLVFWTFSELAIDNQGGLAVATGNLRYVQVKARLVISARLSTLHMAI